MAGAFYLILLAGSVVGVGVNVFSAIRVLKMHGLPVLFAASCLVAAPIFLFLAVWLPLRHHTSGSKGLDGNLAAIGFVLSYLPNAVAWLQRQRKKVSPNNNAG